MYPRVYFYHKLKKLLNGQGFASARQHLRRSFRANSFPLDPAHVIETIDRPKLEKICRRYAGDDPGEDWPKYLHLDHWIDVNIRRIRRLELDMSPTLRLLDLGCGAGYFAYIAKLLGHDVTGLDIDDVPMFGDMTRLLGVPRVIWRIQPFVPLPDLGEKFDFITAFMICFNDHKHPGLWGAVEWDFFLDDLAKHLRPNGRVWLELNREYDGTSYTPELKDYFTRRGAKIDDHRLLFSSDFLVPASTSPADR